MTLRKQLLVSLVVSFVLGMALYLIVVILGGPLIGFAILSVVSLIPFAEFLGDVFGWVVFPILVVWIAAFIPVFILNLIFTRLRKRTRQPQNPPPHP